MKGQVFRKTRACVSLEVVSASSSSSSLCGRFGLRKQRRGALASVGERERGCSKGAEYNTFRQRNVAVRGKFEDKDGKGAKRLKKLLERTEDKFERLLLEFEEQNSKLKAMNAVLQTQVDGLKEERAALAEILQGQKEKTASHSSSNTTSTFTPQTKGEVSSANAKDLFESSTDVSDDIFGAIARVGFPDSYGSSRTEAKRENKEKNSNGERKPTSEAAPLTSTATVRVEEPCSVEDLSAVEGLSTSTSASSAKGNDKSKEELLSTMPSITVGCDDIQLMSLLHTKLEERGFYCTDEETEDWYFGESTQNAVMAFQASQGLTENGSVTRKEWEILLENEEHFSFKEEPQLTEAQGQGQGESESESESESGETEAKTSSSSDRMLGLEDFPMLREGDGGNHVRLLQLALDKRGCCVSEDESEFWFFGDSTVTALKTFQACHHLPESGIVDHEVWAKLCDGMEDEVCNLDFFEKRTGGSSEAEEEDPHNIDRAKKGVFLIGEGRYEDPEKLSERST